MARADRSQVIIAVIGLSGVVATALFANWDKIFTHPAVASAVAPATPPGASSPAPADKAAALVAAQGRALGSEADVLNGIADKIDASNVPQVTGSWRDSDGFRYEFTQQGKDYRFRQFRGAAVIGSGSGSLSGRSFSHDFFAQAVGAGRCTGEVSADGDTASGTCQDAGGRSWPFVVTR